MTDRRDAHTFVICAYGESPYLEECLLSLERQTVRSRICVATSTPGETLRRLCGSRGVPLFVNPRSAGIGADWNFALSRADTPFVTLAHQDDVYLPLYAERMLSAMERSRRPLLFYSGYGELRGDRVVIGGGNLTVKKILRAPMALLPGSRAARRVSLAFGDPIPCPAVTFVEREIRSSPFSEDLRCDLDWDQWERLSRREGSFVFDPGVLMLHRIHPGSETTRVLSANGRRREDEILFRRFWPGSVARALTGLYARSERSNEL